MGRKPQIRNGKPTNVRILETATRLFSEKGYAGTSVDMIVASAGVNKRMVYHYFGSKLALYQRVMLSAYAQLSRLEAEWLEGMEELSEVVERLAELYFAFSRNHPEFTRLLLWENLNKGKGIHSSNESLSKEPILKKLRAALRDAPRGKYRDDIDPRFLFLAVLGLTQIFVSNRYTLSQGLGLDLASPAVQRRGLQNALQFIRAGLKP